MQIFYRGYSNLHSRQQYTRLPFSLHPHRHLLPPVWTTDIPTDVRGCLRVVLLCISLMIMMFRIRNVYDVFTYLLATCTSLRKMFRVCPFLIKTSNRVFICYWGVWVLHIPQIVMHPLRYIIWKSFLPFLGVAILFMLAFFMSSFAVNKAFSFDAVPLVCFCFRCLHLWCQLKLSARLMPRIWSRMFPFRSFMVSSVLFLCLKFKLLSCFILLLVAV